MSTSAQRGQGWHHIPRTSGVVSEREYFERIIAERDRQTDARFTAMQMAIDLAAGTLGTRLEGMNEIRSQLGTQRAEFATNEKLEALATTTRATFDTLSAQIANNAALLRTTTQSDMQQLRERADRDQKTVNDDIRSLRESRSQQAGGSASSREWWGYAIAALAIAGTILSHFIK